MGLHAAAGAPRLVHVLQSAAHVEEVGPPGGLGEPRLLIDQRFGWSRLVQMLDIPLARASDGGPLPEVVIAVATEWRGKGIGGALLDELLRAARQHGHSALTLKVSHRNPGARRLYEIRDFAIFRSEDRGVWMRRDL